MVNSAITIRWMVPNEILNGAHPGILQEVTLHPILTEKLSAALAPVPPFSLTRRDARLPAVPGKAHTVVLNELERRGAEVGYVKTADGLEVDFLARHPAAGEDLIQVCADVSAPDTLSRELRALMAAAKEHPRAERRLLVLDRDALARVTAAAVVVQPAYEWLLAVPNED